MKGLLRRIGAAMLAVSLVLAGAAVLPGSAANADAATKKYVKKLTLSKSSVSVSVGKTVTVKATVAVSGKASTKVTAKGTSKVKVTVKNNKIKIKGLKKGTAKVKVTTAGKNSKGKKITKTITVKVSNPPLSFDYDDRSLSISVMAEFHLEVNDALGEVEWKSSNEDVIKVTPMEGYNNVGVLKTLSVGEATITASCAGQKSASIIIPVTARGFFIYNALTETADLELGYCNIATPTEEYKSGVYWEFFKQFYKTSIDLKGYLDNKELTGVEWSSDNPAVATVSAGHVDARSEGYANIIARYTSPNGEKYADAFQLIVLDNPAMDNDDFLPYPAKGIGIGDFFIGGAIEVTPPGDEWSYFGGGTTTAYAAEIYYNNEVADVSKVTWKSSDESVFKVNAEFQPDTTDETGKKGSWNIDLTYVGAGMASLIAEYNGAEYRRVVICNEKEDKCIEPWTDSTAAQIMSDIGLELNVPTGATEVTYRINRLNQMGEMSFTLDGSRYTARIQSGSSTQLTDISGCYYSWKTDEETTVSDLTARIRDAVDGTMQIRVINWIDVAPGINYSLMTSGSDLSGLDIAAITEQVYKPLQGDS